MTYYIYKFTNKENSKSYIGCTSNLGHRIQQHITSEKYSAHLLHDDIVKYGIEKFTIEIIDTAEYADDAFYAEEFYIKKFGTFVPDGYNQTIGGAGAQGYKGKRVVRLDLEGNYIETFISVNSVQRKGFPPNKVMDCCSGKAHTVQGCQFMFEDDYNKNGGKPYVKPKSTCIKAVIQCDLQGNKIQEFESVVNAADTTGTSRTSITACLHNVYKTANGFIWVTKESYPIKDLSVYVKRKKGTKVFQIDKDTDEIIAEYNSMVDAAKAVGGDHRNIQKVVDMQNRSVYGYRWERATC